MRTRENIVDLIAVREARAAARGDLGQALDTIEADPTLRDGDKHVARALARHATTEGFFHLDWREMEVVCGAVDHWAFLKPWSRLKKRGYVEKIGYSLRRISDGSGPLQNDSGEYRAKRLFAVRDALLVVNFQTRKPYSHKLDFLAAAASHRMYAIRSDCFTADEIEEAARELFKLGYLSRLEFRDTEQGRESRFLIARLTAPCPSPLCVPPSA